MEKEFKLKTLKDLIHYNRKYIHKEDLKQEAIKWIKDFQRDKSEVINPVWAFRKFFNITEKDLK